MIKAVIFDFDGLLVDTETPLYEAYREIFRQYGAELSAKQWGAMLGTNTDPCHVLQQVSSAVVKQSEIQNKVMELHDSLMMNQGPRPGVNACLQEAKRLELKVGLASSATRIWVESYLHKFHLLPFFDCIRTGNHAGKGKPEPEIYLEVLSCLQVSAKEAIAFEDSLHGLQAAKRAGLPCVVVPNPITSHLSFAEADSVIASFEDIPLPKLIEFFRVER